MSNPQNSSSPSSLFLPENQVDLYIEKLDKKLQKLSKTEKISYLQREIENIQSKQGNRS